MALFNGENVYPLVAQFMPFKPGATAPQGVTEGGMWYDFSTKQYKGLVNGLITVLSPVIVSSLAGVQGIQASSPPYNLIFDAGTTPDGVMTNGTTVLTSATANWQTNAKVGQRIWAVESQGGSQGKLAFMGTITSIDSNTQIHVSQTSVCNTANPCTNLWVRWGTGGQNANAQAFIAAISNVNVSLPTCGILPSGGFVWEAAWNGFPAFLLHTRVCLTSLGRTVLFPTPDFAFTPGGQISFANAITAPDLFNYMNLEIDGAGLTTTDGRTPVFQGIGAGGAAIFLSEGNYSNISVHDWGSGVTNWQCITFDNYQWSYNIRCSDAGESQTQGTIPGNPVHIIGGAFTDRSNGSAALVIGSPTETSHCSFGLLGSNWRGVLVNAGTWTSTADSFLATSQTFDQIFMQGANTSANISGATIIGSSRSGGQSVVTTATATATVRISNSVVTAVAGQKAFDTSGGGIILDDCTNTVTGSSDALATGNCGIIGLGSGVASPSTTLFLVGPNSLTNAFTNTTATTIIASAHKTGTLRDLICTATAAGTAAGSGVVTVRTAPLSTGTFASTAITATFGTTTSAKDQTHTAAVTLGQPIQIQITTQAAETLAGVFCSLVIR